jgi:hypothetical protein
MRRCGSAAGLSALPCAEVPPALRQNAQYPLHFLLCEARNSL